MCRPISCAARPAAEVWPTELPSRSVDEAALEAASELIDGAGSVAIWVGGGVIEAGATGLLSSLAAHLQAPVITTFSSRGALSPTDPSNVVLPPHEPEVEDLLSSADVLLAIGTDFDGMMTKNATLRLPPAIVDVNVDPDRTSFGYSGVTVVHGDAKAAIAGLAPNDQETAGGPDLSFAGTERAGLGQAAVRPAHKRSGGICRLCRARRGREGCGSQRYVDPRVLAGELLLPTARAGPSSTRLVGALSAMRSPPQ